MAVNRYTEYNPQQYVSNYVPLPLEMMYQGLANKQKQFDTTMDDTYKLQDLMAKVNAIDKHKQYKKQLEDKYYPKIEEIANEITKTGDLTKARDIKRIAREWEHDPLRQELEASYANYQAYAADKIKKGEKYGEWYDNYLPFTGSDEQGNIAGYRYTGMGEVQDHQKRAHDMMDKVASDALKSAGFKMNADGTIIKGGSGWEKVAAEKIQQLAQMKSLDFLSTSEGKDYAKMLKYYNPNMSDKDLINQATQYLYDAGANQIFGKSESESDIGFTPWAKDIYDQQMANRTTSRQSEAISNPTLDDPTKDLKFDDKGNLIPVTFEEQTYAEPGSNGYYEGNIVKRGTGKTGLNAEETNRQNLLIATIQKEHPELKGMKPKQVVEAYRKAIKAVSSESIPLQSITNEAASKGIGAAIARNKQGRSFYIQDGSGTTMNGDWKTVIDELGISEEEFNKHLENGIGGYTQAGATPGAYYVEIPTDNNTTRRVLIAPDAEIQAIFRTSQALNTARKSLTRTVVKPFGENYPYAIEVIPEIKSDGTPTWKYEEITMENGEIKRSKTDLDQIREAEKKAMESSNYIGTNVTSMKPHTVQ